MENLWDYCEQNVKQKRIVITGGTTGIGKATANLLVSLGARVLIFGRDTHDFNTAVEDIKKNFPEGEIYGAPADATKKEDMQMIWEMVDTQLGGIDILINNAAIAGNGITNESYEDWKYILETNVMGYLDACQEAVSRMTEKKSGHIVNIGSMSAETREKTGTVYVATKAAIRGFSASLRKEINPLGIKVTLIEPGSVVSDIHSESKEEQEKKMEKLEMLKADDIAVSVLFCISQPLRSDIISLQIKPHLQII